MAISAVNIQKFDGKDVEGWSVLINEISRPGLRRKERRLRRYLAPAVTWLIAVLYFQAENPNAALNFYWEALKKAVSLQQSQLSLLSVMVSTVVTRSFKLFLRRLRGDEQWLPGCHACALVCSTV
jgi:hypothetical protein